MKGNKAIIVKVAIGILVVCGIFLGITLFAVGDDVFNRVTRWQLAREGFEVNASGTLIAYTDSKEEAVVEIPQGITMIGDFAFSICENVVTINIPDSVTSIETGAFSGCSSLTSVSIPDSVTSIGTDAFAGCTSLENIPESR